MKKLSILLLVASAVAVLFSSCNKEYAEPTIAWTPDTLSSYVTIGDETTYNTTLEITANAEAGISTIEVYKYIYTGEDYTTVAVDGPTGYTDLTAFTWTLTTQNVETDFAGGVTSIVYEVAVTDASEVPQTTTKDYTFMVDEAYTVTMIIEDEDGTLITDATVTFDGSELTASPYEYEYVMPGTYTYTVEATGFESVNVTDFVMPSSDTTFTVTMLASLSAWSDTTLLALQGQQTWATYEGEAVTIYESAEIGVGFTYTDAGIGRITTTTGCEGWVVVADVSGFTTYSQIVDAYTNGTHVTQIDLNVDQRAYEEVYFVAKIGTEYKLVRYVLGHRSATTGNILGFTHKTKA